MFSIVEIDAQALVELQLICSGLSFDANMTSELISKTKFLEVYQLLMDYTKNVKQVILILNEFVPKIVHDIDSKVRNILRLLDNTTEFAIPVTCPWARLSSGLSAVLVEKSRYVSPDERNTDSIVIV